MKSKLQQMLYSASTPCDAIAMRPNFLDLRPPRGYGFSTDSVGRISVTSKVKGSCNAEHVHGVLSRAWARAQ